MIGILGDRREDMNGGSGRVGWASGTSAVLGGKSPCGSDEEREDVSHRHHGDSDDNIDVLESDDEELDLLSSDSCLSGHDGVGGVGGVRHMDPPPTGQGIIPPTAAMMMASVLPTSASASTDLGIWLLHQ